MQVSNYRTYNFEIVEKGYGYAVKIEKTGHWLLSAVANKLSRTHYLDLVSPAYCWPESHHFFGDCVGTKDRCERIIKCVRGWS